jgi:hypothetical protein
MVMRSEDRAMLADALLMAHSGLVSREGHFSRAAMQLATEMGTAPVPERGDAAREREVAGAAAMMGSDIREADRDWPESILGLLRRTGTRLDLQAVWQYFEAFMTPLKNNQFMQARLSRRAMTSANINPLPRVSRAHSALCSPSGASDRIGSTGGLD